MTNNLPTVTSKSQIAPLPPEMSRRVETIYSKLTPCRNLRSRCIAERDAPTGTERDIIAGRVTVLESAMVAAEKPRVMQYLAAMFLGYPSVRADAAEAQKTLALYHSQIAGMPLFAVKEGCEAMMRRNSPFPPSVGELYHACVGATQSVAREARKLTAILQAEIIPEEPERSPEERRRFVQMLKTLGVNDVAVADKGLTNAEGDRQ